MKQTLALALICLLFDLSAASPEWEEYKRKFGKQYDSAEEDQSRKEIFELKVREIEHFNKHHEEEFGYLKGVNHRTDWTSEEKSRSRGPKLPPMKPVNSEEAQRYLDELLRNIVDVPDKVDWRIEGRVTKVRNQEHCSAGWAFAALGALEGQQKSQGMKNLVWLSVQDLIDCSRSNFGCSGGYPFRALIDISLPARLKGGIVSEKSYPFNAYTYICRQNASKIIMTTAGAVALPLGDEETLKKVVATFGPVATIMDANNIDEYKSGVYTDPECDLTDLNQGVLIVGYDTDAKQGDYWIVKNSFSPNWGQQGYFWIARNKNNTCGIASMATIPLMNKRTV